MHLYFSTCVLGKNKSDENKVVVCVHVWTLGCKVKGFVSSFSFNSTEYLNKIKILKVFYRPDKLTWQPVEAK